MVLRIYDKVPSCSFLSNNGGRKRDYSLFWWKWRRAPLKVCRPTVGILSADRIPTVYQQLTDCQAMNFLQALFSQQLNCDHLSRVKSWCTYTVIKRKATFISKFTSLRSFPACNPLLWIFFFFRLIGVFNTDTKLMFLTLNLSDLKWHKPFEGC